MAQIARIPAFLAIFLLCLPVFAQGGALTLVYPPEGAVFPPDMARPPTFRWEPVDKDAACRIEIVFSDGQTVAMDVTGDRWRPEETLWSHMKSRTVEKAARVVVHRGEATARTTFSTAADPVGAPIFYREVPLPFKTAFEDMRSIKWRLGRVDSPAPPRTVLENMPLCGNCHSFDARGNHLAMDVDYGNDKGSYIIADIAEETVFSGDRVISWSDYRREDGRRTFGLLARISPDARYVVGTVKDRSVFVPVPDIYYSQYFFPVQGVLVVYDREAEAFSSLPGADDPEYVQSSPAWTPDGQWIIFARARAYQLKGLANPASAVIRRADAEEFFSGGKKFRYDLYRVPFNNGRGGMPEPIPGASGNGRSNYFPTVSPDGKWLVFCQADSFMLLRPDSTLYIMPLSGGTPRRMNCNREGLMNSWHSWSPNGRWLVFASKAAGPYTRLWLTHVDEDGVDSPPVMLEGFLPPRRAANIPEFVNLGDRRLVSIRNEFADEGARALRGGDLLYRQGRFEDARAQYRKALGVDPRNGEALLKIGKTFLAERQPDPALDFLRKALRETPEDQGIQTLLATAFFQKAVHEDAIVHAGSALAGGRPDPQAQEILALSHHRLGNLEKALEYYPVVVSERPFPNLLIEYAAALETAGRTDEAVVQLQRALAADPANTDARKRLLALMKRRAKK